MDGSVLLLILVVVAIVFVAFYANGRKSSGQASPRERRARGDETRTRDASRAADATRIAQDMRGMKTSRVADAVEILDDLGRITPGYRQYCELVGTSMRDGGVVAPYSKQEVAYYDVRCYRVERRDDRDVETLVAREKSVKPLWFTDGSSDERVRVDVASFGDDMTLVTAMDHVEGPDSDFARAFAGAPAVSAQRDEDAGRAGRDAGREASPASGRAGFATGMPGGLQDFLAGVDPRVLEDMRDFARRGGRGSDLAEIGGALLGAGIGALVNSLGSQPGRPGTPSSQPVNYPTQQPSPNYPTQRPAQYQGELRGYRLVEDVVPLGSPVFCLGELYRMGGELCMGRSIAAENPSSYFATKPEAEVIKNLQRSGGARA